MTKEEALAIAVSFRDRRGDRTTIDHDTVARLYESFEGATGPAWVIEALLPPSTFEGSNTITYVVCITEKTVRYIINSSGFVRYPDKPEAKFTDGELDELKDMGFDVID